MPHISLVSCEMWESAALNLKLFDPNDRHIEIRGIPHLAKNERDVGHPRFCYWDKGLLHHDGSASAWPILIEQEGQGDHQGRGKGKNVVHVDVGESLRLCLKLLI